MTTLISILILLIFLLVTKKTSFILLIKKSLIAQSILLLSLIILMGYNLLEYKNNIFYNIKVGSILIAIIFAIPYYLKKFKNSKTEA